MGTEIKLLLLTVEDGRHDRRVDILDPDLAARIGALGAADADGVGREACALFAAGYGRRDARDLARALHWLLRGNPLVCSSTQIMHALANGAGSARSGAMIPSPTLPDEPPAAGTLPARAPAAPPRGAVPSLAGLAGLPALSDAQCAALAVALDLNHGLDQGTARADGSLPPHGATADLIKLLALGRRLALALELLRRPDYFLSEMYRGEELLIG
ncbi:hypothetical protein [Parafrankia sp. BMG5.11]|uniref:hypothetical protein n=1 Tax=Parafrankia sp. BMG5.11 TaxID=222540 RepID=UPI00103918BD|nr:hypothetical protein [Parafrankia sp. BMG5.11]TCJ34132.1 hypothetical protein E0504_33155 [Parafrankia sp. BMG5.11]